MNARTIGQIRSLGERVCCFLYPIDYNNPTTERGIVETIDVVAAIIRHDDKIFATQRGYGDFAGGWEFPGGKIEAGETPEAALTREIREELATRIAVDSHFMTVEYDYPAFHLSMRCYLCHVVEGDLTLLEHASARWLNASTIDEVAWLPADDSIIERIKSELFRR